MFVFGGIFGKLFFFVLYSKFIFHFAGISPEVPGDSKIGIIKNQKIFCQLLTSAFLLRILVHAMMGTHSTSSGQALGQGIGCGV
jgi:hypothetical protein